MAKKISSLEDLGGFVFSTNKDFEFDQNSETEETLNPNRI
jgi:translation initiation factor 1